MSESHRALLIGFGHVGQRLCSLLGDELRKHPQLAELNLRFVGIFTRNHGAWVDPHGIDPEQAVRSYRESGGFPDRTPQSTSLTVLEAVETLDYDVLIELSALSIEEEGRPALDYVRTALERSRHVVTANKGPAAFALRELQALAATRSVQFRFESAVLDGCPVINLAETCLSSTRVQRLEGVLNCTSNFVLAQGLRSGRWQDALEEAQHQGFAEADPSHDLLGWDSAAKLTILANSLLGAELTPLDIPRVEVDEALIRELKSRHKEEDCWKIVACAERRRDRVEPRVELRNLPAQHPFRSLSPSSGGLLIETDLTSPIFLGQQDPDLTDTAFGVLQDLWSLFRQTPSLL